MMKSHINFFVHRDIFWNSYASEKKTEELRNNVVNAQNQKKVDESLGSIEKGIKP